MPSASHCGLHKTACYHVALWWIHTAKLHRPAAPANTTPCPRRCFLTHVCLLPVDTEVNPGPRPSVYINQATPGKCPMVTCFG